ncbi:MAG: peptide deformylase [Clostridia bacterium]|nr:peptide deformylase [Clostridia bacterium]
MALRNIVPDTDEVMHKKCRPVDKIDAKIITLLDDMIDTLKDAEGVGLAAPQVGVLRRIFVINTMEEPEEFIEFINPEIIETSGTQEGSEGCLSIKGFEGFVIRPMKVKVKALNRYGEEFIFEGEELMARACCHESDHLEGKTIRDTCEYEVFREDD